MTPFEAPGEGLLELFGPRKCIRIVNLIVCRRVNKYAYAFAVVCAMGEENFAAPIIFPNIYISRFRMFLVRSKHLPFNLSDMRRYSSFSFVPSIHES